MRLAAMSNELERGGRTVECDGTTGEFSFEPPRRCVLPHVVGRTRSLRVEPDT